MNSEEFSLDIFLKNARPTDFFEKVRKAAQKKHANQLIDPTFLRQGRDWAKIANQVVGAENSE